MTRAKLFNPKARKQFECRGEGPKHFIKPGEKYWCVTAMRQQPARFCDAHKPTDEYVSNFGPKSRADRAFDCADQFNDAGIQLNEIAEEIGHILDEPMEEELKEGETEENAPLTADQVERLLKLKPRLEEIGPDGSDFTALADELRSWADNMSGTGLENTGKYSEVDDAAGEAEGVDVDGFEVPSWPTENGEPVVTRETMATLKDECETASGDAETIGGEMEGCSWPQMY